MQNIAKKFFLFLENLKNEENISLIETIQKGFKSIDEAIGTDDANAKRIGYPTYQSNLPSCVGIFPNINEYFPQTLPKSFLKRVNQAQAGKKTWLYPKAGKGTVTLDPLKSGHGNNYNANIPSGEWAGDSGGYNLGGPYDVASYKN